jgi:hypothetical protein
MANLSYTEKRILEAFIDIGQGKGYVLNFSDRTFAEFVRDATGIDIDAEKYNKFLKELCKSNGVDFAKDETVNALFGKYIKAIRAKNLIKSSMGEVYI